jgi:hypothetical protein
MVNKKFQLGILIMLFGMVIVGCFYSLTVGETDSNGETWSGIAGSYGPLVIMFYDTTFEMIYTNTHFEPDNVFGFRGTYTYSGDTFTGICTSTKAGNDANWSNNDIYNISPFSGTRSNNILSMSKAGNPWLDGAVLTKQ